LALNQPQNTLETSIEYLKGIGPKKGDLFREAFAIRKFSHMLSFFPFRYVDKSQYYAINELKNSGAEVQLKGTITKMEIQGAGRKKRLKAVFSDGQTTMELIWFRAADYIKKSIKLKKEYVIFGKVTLYNGQWQMTHPQMDLSEKVKENRHAVLQAVYPSTEKLNQAGVTNKSLSVSIFSLFEQVHKEIVEVIPPWVCEQYKLMNRKKAYFNVHFPQSHAVLEKARRRVIFEEFFFLQLALLQQKSFRKQKMNSYAFTKVGDFFNSFYKEGLPFDLTGAQKRVLKEIRADVFNGRQMSRLIQGDVGSGKTIVALLSMLIAMDNGFQASLMAPTEILAQQHYIGLQALLADFPVKIALLTGSSKVKQRRLIHEGLENGEIHILIGTHAIIEEKVKFKNIGIAIIDEQHRFGVAQRSKMWKKNARPPHILIMTATPIPRTLAMTSYGDLDVSVIDELPPGRKEVKTVHRYENNRLGVFGFMRGEIKKGRQVYIVYPLIEESSKLDYQNLMDGYENVLREFPNPEYQISILHGRMKPKDKDLEMERFVRGESQIMVATTVIEVGVNVPNASVMIIESTEKFGLSQLHQLRGRVGRGADQSYCILMSSYKLGEEAKFRLETMVRTTDGFEIAEADLKLRGPGDIMGTQQSGLLDFKMASLTKDKEELLLARAAAAELLEKDPQLNDPTAAKTREYFLRNYRKMVDWSQIS